MEESLDKSAPLLRVKQEEEEYEAHDIEAPATENKLESGKMGTHSVLVTELYNSKIKTD